MPNNEWVEIVHPGLPKDSVTPTGDTTVTVSRESYEQDGGWKSLGWKLATSSTTSTTEKGK